MTAQPLEDLAELLRAGRDDDCGLEALEDVGGDTLEERDARLQAGCEVELAVHCALGDGRDLVLDADEGRDLIDDFLLDQRRVHVEDAEPPVPPEHVRGLQDDLAVPFALEFVDRFVFMD